MKVNNGGSEPKQKGNKILLSIVVTSLLMARKIFTLYTK